MNDFIRFLWNGRFKPNSNRMSNHLASSIVEISDEILSIKCRLHAIQHECKKHNIGKSVMYEVNFSIIDMSDLESKLLSIATGIRKNHQDVQSDND